MKLNIFEEKPTKITIDPCRCGCEDRQPLEFIPEDSPEFAWDEETGSLVMLDDDGDIAFYLLKFKPESRTFERIGGVEHPMLTTNYEGKIVCS